MRQKQLIYTQSVSIKSKNIEMIEFIKEKANLFHMLIHIAKPRKTARKYAGLFKIKLFVISI